MCSGTLRRYLAHHGGIPKKPLTAAMPISLREAGNTEYGTQATMPLVNLQTHIADPLRRLRAIRDAAGAVKAMVRSAKSIMPTDFPSIGVPWLLQGIAALYERSQTTGAIPPLANGVVSNRGFITTPLERAIAAADGIEYIQSKSSQCMSSISVRLKLKYDPIKALAEISSKVDQVRQDLPPEAEVPVLNIKSADQRVRRSLSEL